MGTPVLAIHKQQPPIHDSTWKTFKKENVEIYKMRVPKGML